MVNHGSNSNLERCPYLILNYISKNITFNKKIHIKNWKKNLNIYWYSQILIKYTHMISTKPICWIQVHHIILKTKTRKEFVNTFVTELPDPTNSFGPFTKKAWWNSFEDKQFSKQVWVVHFIPKDQQKEPS